MQFVKEASSDCKVRRTLQEHDNLNLDCVVTGYPTPNVYWYYESNETSTLISGGSKLIVNGLTRDQSGSYTCVSTNGISRDIHREFEVEVLSK